MSRIPLAALALTSLVCTSPLHAQSGATRFALMDRNNDGTITKSEWRGTAQSFRVHDWNNDGVLSGDELRTGFRRDGSFDSQDFDPPTASRFSAWDENGFSNLDHNRDGRITWNEWHYDTQTFNRIDRNRDGALSRSEFLATDGVDDDRDDSFDNLDRNGNGYVDRYEWHSSADVFDSLDRDRDGILSRTEMTGRRGGALRDGSDQFSSLDGNRDGQVSPEEWHWSRRSFDNRDLNRDGRLTRGEMYNPISSGAAATSGQMVRVDPSQRWTDTGLYVRAGDTITLSADGQIQMSTTDPNDQASPSGSSTGRRAQDAPLRAEPAGALIARVGDSAPWLVGNQRSIRAPVSGRLYLGVNDDHLPDNSGEYRVNVTIDGR